MVLSAVFAYGKLTHNIAYIASPAILPNHELLHAFMPRDTILIFNTAACDGPRRLKFSGCLGARP